MHSIWVTHTLVEDLVRFSLHQLGAPAVVPTYLTVPTDLYLQPATHTAMTTMMMLESFVKVCLNSTIFLNSITTFSCAYSVWYAYATDLGHTKQILDINIYMTVIHCKSEQFVVKTFVLLKTYKTYPVKHSYWKELLIYVLESGSLLQKLFSINSFLTKIYSIKVSNFIRIQNFLNHFRHTD